jgi:hypothetical protein
MSLQILATPIAPGGRALYRLYQRTAATGACPIQSWTQTAPTEASQASPTTHSSGTDADAS